MLNIPQGPGSSERTYSKRSIRAFYPRDPSGEQAPVRPTRWMPYRLSPAHPGLTCLGTGKTVTPPPGTILTLPPRPERYLIRPPCEQT